MELKEAINKLNETCKQCHNSKECWDNEFCPDCYVEVEDIFAIETVLKALEDYKKENEELKNIDLTTVYLKGVADGKERWRNKIREKIDNRISTIENLLDEMVDKSIGCINVSYLSKKEKEKVILKRNCLTVQKATLINIKKDLLKEE